MKPTTGDDIDQPRVRSFAARGHGGYAEGPGTLRASGGDYGGGSEILVVFHVKDEGGGQMENKITEAEWLEDGRRLAAELIDTQWQIGDWLVAGLALYSDPRQVYDAAEKVFLDYPRDTLRHFAVTARAFPPCTRIHSNLSFGHYRVAQSLPDGMISEFLAKADRERWPVAKLRLVVHDFQYQQFHPGSRSTPSPKSEQDKIITPSVEQEVASALRNQGYGAQEAARVARQTQADDFEAAFVEAQRIIQPPTATEPAPKPSTAIVAPGKPQPDCIRLLPIPYAVQLKLRALARLYRMPPDALIARMVDSFLELHADDVAACEQQAADREDDERRWFAEMDAANRRAAFEQTYGMAEEEWRQLTQEQQAAQVAEMDRRRAEELAAQRAAHEEAVKQRLAAWQAEEAAERQRRAAEQAAAQAAQAARKAAGQAVPVESERVSA